MRQRFVNSILFLFAVAGCSGTEAPLAQAPSLAPPSEPAFLPVDDSEQGANPCADDLDCAAGQICSAGNCVAQEGELDEEDPSDGAEAHRDAGNSQSEGEPTEVSDAGAGDAETPVWDAGGPGGDSDPEIEPDDAGPTDDAEDHSGTVCQPEAGVNFGQGDCAADYICVPQGNATAGTCRLSCLVETGPDVWDEDPSICAAGLTCQTLLPLTLNELVAVGAPGDFTSVCLAPVEDDQTPCAAVYDLDACTEGRDCQVTDYDYVYDAFGSLDDILFHELRCRAPCDLESGETCPDGEACLLNQDPIMGFDIAWEGDDPTTEAQEAYFCDKAACDDTSSATYCACGAGFECLTYGENTFCGQYFDTGWCGTPVELFSPDDWEIAITTGWPQEKICNDIDDTLLCNDEPFRPESVGAALGCVGISSTTNDGICMAFCDVPADPADPFDPGFQGSCPTGYECSLDLGVALVFGPWLDAWGYVESRAEALTCNPLSCPEGFECASCLHPGAQCGVIPIDSAGNTFSGCFMPYQFCQAD